MSQPSSQPSSQSLSQPLSQSLSQPYARTLNRQDYKTLALASLGGALEFYDFIIFVFLAKIIGVLFFPENISPLLRDLQTLGIFAAGYLVRPLGGIILAHFGDMIGRKKIFTLSILLMALPTLCIGLLPDYGAIGAAAPLLLLLMRVLQGIAIGGEVPGAWVFVAEHVPTRRIGLACGILTSGLTFGILIGSVMATIINVSMSTEQIHSIGWRIPFFIGGIFGLIAMYLRRWLQETPIFIEMQQQKALAKKLPLKSVIESHKKSIIISMLLTWLLSAGIVVVILLAPSWLETTHGITPALALQSNIIATLTLTIGCLIYGFIIDKLGAKITFMAGSIFLALASLSFYYLVGKHPEQLFLLYGLAGLSVGIVGAVPYVMVRLFPAAVRFSGISFSYNIAYAIFGGLTPVVVRMMTNISQEGHAWYVAGLALIGLILSFWLRTDLYYKDEKYQQKTVENTQQPQESPS